MMIAETVMGYKDGGKIPEDAVLREDVGSAKKGGDMPKEEGNMCGWGKALWEQYLICQYPNLLNVSNQNARMISGLRD